ncbi:MAG: hypothetical protein ACKO0V_22405, partial [bacterium]
MLESIFTLAQAGAAAAAEPMPPPIWIQNLLGWLYLIGDPAFTTKGLLGSMLTWTKIIGLFCLMSWIGARTLSAIKQRIEMPALSGIAAAGLLGGLVSILLQQLQITGRLALPLIAGVSPAVILGIVSLIAVLVWVEAMLWISMKRDSNKGDRILLLGMHAAFVFGILNGLLIYYFAVVPPGITVTIVDFVAQGARMGLTYMGYMALLLLVVRLGAELGVVNPVRTLAIAWLARKEANRRMWAPY